MHAMHVLGRVITPPTIAMVIYACERYGAHRSTPTPHAKYRGKENICIAGGQCKQFEYYFSFPILKERHVQRIEPLLVLSPHI